jgi:hypothetical protein
VYDPVEDRLFIKTIVVEEPNTWDTTPDLDIEIDPSSQLIIP